MRGLRTAWEVRDGGGGGGGQRGEGRGAGDGPGGVGGRVPQLPRTVFSVEVEVAQVLVIDIVLDGVGDGVPAAVAGGNVGVVVVDGDLGIVVVEDHPRERGVVGERVGAAGSVEVRVGDDRVTAQEVGGHVVQLGVED